MKVILKENQKKKREIYRIEKNSIVVISKGQLMRISNSEIACFILDNGDVITVTRRRYGNS